MERSCCNCRLFLLCFIGMERELLQCKRCRRCYVRFSEVRGNEWNYTHLATIRVDRDTFNMCAKKHSAEKFSIAFIGVDVCDGCSS